MPFYPEGLERAQAALSSEQASLNLSAADALTTPALTTPDEGDAGLLDSPGLQGSFQQILAENLGHYVQIDFLVGVETLVRRSGIIYAVGRSFVVLYDESNQNFVMCDVFSAKFVAFFARRPAPGVLPNNPMGILKVDATGNLWPVEAMENAPSQLPGAVQPRQGGGGNAAGQRVRQDNGWVSLG